MYQKRKICFVITSKIHYGRSKTILRELNNRDDIDLQIVVGASAILPQYGDVITELENDGFTYHAKIFMTLEGGSSVAMAKTAGLGIAEFATAFDNLSPNIVLIRGDRYEVLSAAVAAAYLNIPVAHIEGGDVTGTIDESVRHAITKLSHIHFTTNEESKKRVLKMGEKPDYVFNVGCPGLEYIAQNNFQVSSEIINYLGVGDVVDISKPYIVVMQHPVTSEISKNREYVNETLESINNLNLPTIWFWPNVDAGTDEVSKAIRSFREEKKPEKIRFLKYIPAEQFIGLIKGASCLVGNSSAGIKEASYLGTPVVDIGTRQKGRMRAENVVNVNYNRGEIKYVVEEQLKHGRYPSSSIYYKEGTSQSIVHILSSIDLYTQKKFYDSENN